MKDTSTTDRSRGCPRSSGLTYRMLVRSMVTTRGIGPDGPGQLAIAHIDGEDLGRPVLQEAGR